MPRIRLPFISRRKWDKLRKALSHESAVARCKHSAYNLAGYDTGLDRSALKAEEQCKAYTHALELLELIEHEK